MNSPLYHGSNHYNYAVVQYIVSFQVYEELEAIGAASAEARARRILAVSALTRWAGPGGVVRILTVSALTRWVEPGGVVRILISSERHLHERCIHVLILMLCGS